VDNLNNFISGRPSWKCWARKRQLWCDKHASWLNMEENRLRDHEQAMRRTNVVAAEFAVGGLAREVPFDTAASA
jgi:hypothetical protein